MGCAFSPRPSIGDWGVGVTCGDDPLRGLRVGQHRRSCYSRGDTRRLVPVLLHGKVFTYYAGTVSIGVDVDETDWA